MGNAGRVDFPAYMKEVHGDWLDKDNVDQIQVSLTQVMNEANSPYASASAFNPDVVLDEMNSIVSNFSDQVNAFSPLTEWNNLIDAVSVKVDSVLYSETHISELVSAFAAETDDQVGDIVIPKFEGGMRDLNAVVSSSFAIGRSIIYGMRGRDVARFSADLRHKMEMQRNEYIGKSIDTTFQNTMVLLEFKKLVAHYTLEVNRLRVVAMKEHADTITAYAVGDAKWPFEVFQMGGNILGAIGGGTAIYNDTARGPSTTQSAISGALAGASIGSKIGDGWGAAAGAVLGAILGSQE